MLFLRRFHYSLHLGQVTIYSPNFIAPHREDILHYIHCSIITDSCQTFYPLLLYYARLSHPRNRTECYSTGLIVDQRIGDRSRVSPGLLRIAYGHIVPAKSPADSRPYIIGHHDPIQSSCRRHRRPAQERVSI